MGRKREEERRGGVADFIEGVGGEEESGGVGKGDGVGEGDGP